MLAGSHSYQDILEICYTFVYDKNDSCYKLLSMFNTIALEKLWKMKLIIVYCSHLKSTSAWMFLFATIYRWLDD